METFETYLLKCGLTTRTQQIKTILDGSQEQFLGGQLQTDIGLIYGMSVYADTVDPNNIPLITTSQAQLLYLTIVMGASQIMKTWRLDDLLNEFAGSPIIRTAKYTPVVIPYYDFEQDKSFYNNPTGITAAAPGVEVYLNLWYIPRVQYTSALERGMIFHPDHPQAPKPIRLQMPPNNR